MSSVAQVELSEFMVSRGGTVDPSQYPDEEFELYSIPAFDTGTPDITEGAQIGSNKQIVKPGDVLLSKIVPHIRRAWIVEPHTDRRLIASGEWIIFRSKMFYPNYLRQLLISDAFHSQFMNTVAGVGGSLLRARPSFVARISVPLPSISEQQRIAEVLDRVDALREKRRKAIALLDDLAQSIFLDMFPTTMKTVKLSESLSFVTSGGRGWAKYYSENGTRFIRSLDVRMNWIDDADAAYVNAPDNAEAKRTRVFEGDVLLTITGSRIGRVAPVLGTLDGAYVSQHVAILRPQRDTIDPKFLAFFLSLPARGQKQIRSMQYGQTKPGLNFEQIRSIEVPDASLEQQRRFGDRLQSVQFIAEEHRNHLAELDALFASLQSRAFRGELWQHEAKDLVGEGVS
ncbi:restriction endonuclease subunit S [Nocardia sp. ET3-3]|uniref:Restriction endonuclease subunit S n=1 Tax=Nocardia terrae TaxID=2675851 RepID=A0A7K1V6N7_9NOCA|nr:restriction endonuclease subunit S [Nocardia terrae]MVU82305.1 restriction endonuclease subunit S [Nocardia terrae]